MEEYHLPFIDMKTSQAITPETEKKIKKDFGQAIECIKGKTESWLMLCFEGNQKIWFQGTDEPAAMVQVDIFGTASDKEYQELTKQISSILNKELQIPQNRIYVKYTENVHWGWNGSIFNSHVIPKAAKLNERRFQSILCRRSPSLPNMKIFCW
jgi:phenylpyruvate tautomerase PptA (4-oxalocrotonate tautomerase family)